MIAWGPFGHYQIRPVMSPSRLVTSAYQDPLCLNCVISVCIKLNLPSLGIYCDKMQCLVTK